MKERVREQGPKMYAELNENETKIELKSEPEIVNISKHIGKEAPRNRCEKKVPTGAAKKLFGYRRRSAQGSNFGPAGRLRGV